MVVHQLHLAALLKNKSINKDAWATKLPADKKVMETEALKTSKQAYLACLFMLMADEDWYGGVKSTLDDNYLLGKQEYPQDLLASKRLLADFKGAGPKVRKKVIGSEDDHDIAFVEQESGGFIPTCHGCGNKCKGGWRRCKNITDEHSAKIAALDAAGHFRRRGRHEEGRGQGQHRRRRGS